MYELLRSIFDGKNWSFFHYSSELLRLNKIQKTLDFSTWRKQIAPFWDFRAHCAFPIKSTVKDVYHLVCSPISFVVVKLGSFWKPWEKYVENESEKKYASVHQLTYIIITRSYRALCFGILWDCFRFFWIRKDLVI